MDALTSARLLDTRSITGRSVKVVCNRNGQDLICTEPRRWDLQANAGIWGFFNIQARDGQRQ